MPSDKTLTQPRQHPLFSLLFVCRALRDEISTIIYTKASLRFWSPARCASFLDTTAPHLKFLSTLTISVPADKTETLEPVFRKLYLARAKLRRLVIHLDTPGGHFAPRQHIVTAYMLPRRMCMSAEGLRIVSQGSANRYGGYGIILDDNSKNWTYEHERHVPMAVELSKSCNSALAKMEGIRWIQVHGQPLGKNSLEFEMAILRICGSMREVEELERREIVWGKYASRAKLDTWWWFEGWIDGEEEGGDWL